MSNIIPARLLIIDDLFGREIPGAVNRERRNLCGKFLLEEESLSGKGKSARFEIDNPTARVVFCRGQTPVESGIGVVVENDLDAALNKVREGWTAAMGKGQAPWSMLLLDLCFYTGRVTEASHRQIPGMPEGRAGDDDPRNYFGLTLLDAIHSEFPELPIFILSSKPRKEVSLEFSRRGALGFIARDDARAPELLEEALWHHGLLPDSAGEVVGNSLLLLLALREARRAAQHRENLLLRGERGTGKELLARYVHRMSVEIPNHGGVVGSSSKPFVAVNSAVFTPNLFASELFGIKPRTATGVDGKIGLIESANGGDLFLDEIADMPSEVQAALLDVLQKRQFTQVGARKPKIVDVRFLSATNAPIEEESHGFRSDLYDRLSIGGTIWLPPLRERPADIPTLVDRFIREAEAQRKGALRREITYEALDMLIAYDWPGNIRELRSVIFDAVSRQPDVEFLVPGHLRMKRRAGRASPEEAKKAVGPRGQGILIDHAEEVSRPQNDRPTDYKNQIMENGVPGGTSLEALEMAIERFAFDANFVGEWAGRLYEVQTVCSRLLARYLQICLEVTKRRTLDNPGGVIQIHPAVKLITGDRKITASKAADLIKRILAPLEKELIGDMREAYEIAVRLRPKSSGSLVRKEQNSAP